ncbi:hypothetical protein T10_11811 [Trichinella papuae]|uniref:Uncharacterized protein n=1 Tax=Trichinella papuae TaxID=268474 RepID=A0A0V1LZU7_9BILA|nr:hypothetical protein T10_11811 [Trichinella papuae]
MGAKLSGGKLHLDEQNSVVRILWRGNGTGGKKATMVDRLEVGGEKTALGHNKCKGVFAEKAARGGKMLVKLFGGKLPHARQNSAGLDFVERKRQWAEKILHG